MKTVKIIIFYLLFAGILLAGYAFLAPTRGERFSLADIYWICAMLLFVPTDLWLHHKTSRLIAIGVLTLAWLVSVGYYWFCDNYGLIIHANSKENITLAGEYRFHQYWQCQGIFTGYLLLATTVSHLLKKRKVICDNG